LKGRIINYTSELSKVTDFIQENLEEYFKTIDYQKISNEIQITKIENEEGLNKIIYGVGFYIILTDQIFENNDCKFEYNRQKAIYRGHSYFSKKRLLSHLANEKYNRERKISEPNYKVCLKIENGKNGINISQKPYKEWNWTVIVHKMKNSSKLMREQAEKAFDKVYNRPCKSREN
jgi:hypothetical protein